MVEVRILASGLVVIITSTYIRTIPTSVILIIQTFADPVKLMN